MKVLVVNVVGRQVQSVQYEWKQNNNQLQNDLKDSEQVWQLEMNEWHKQEYQLKQKKQKKAARKANRRA